MHRPIVYTAEGLRSADFLNASKGAMVGLAKLAGAVLGQATVVNGLACTPGAGLTVNLGIGEIYSQWFADTSTYGTLAADSHVMLKQGMLEDPVVLSTPAPGTAGQSINYLIQVQFQEVDASNTSLPFYNSATPTVPTFANGNTLRKDICAYQVKAGTAAATGSQVTPTPDAGWTGIWTVTSTNGLASIPTGNIAPYAGAPFLVSNLAALGLKFWTAGGSANALTIAPGPPVSAYVDGQLFGVRVSTNNTGAATLDAGPGAKPIRRTDDGAMAMGDLKAGQTAVMWYDATTDHFRMLGSMPSQWAGAGIAINGTGGLRVDITGQTSKTAPAAADELMIWDVGSNVLKKTTVGGVGGNVAYTDEIVSNDLFIGMM